MKYKDIDHEISVGDSVMYDNKSAVIVFVIDDDSYSIRYPKEDWHYLGSSFGVEVQDGHTLYHLNAPDEDLTLVNK